MQNFEAEGIVPQGSTKRLDDDKELRIDNQYYLKNKDAKVNYDALLEFVWGIKDTVSKLAGDKIQDIRDALQKSLR